MVNVRPPNSPWIELRAARPSTGCASFFHSDPLAAVPVRHITRLGDNKSDPNVETASYGLFSTCSHIMRASVVKHRSRYLFFVTRWRGRRVLAGYYRVRWYAPGPLARKPADFALAADKTRFVEHPVPLAELPAAARRALTKRWRLSTSLDPRVTAELLKLLQAEPDAQAVYLREIRRLEQFNAFRSGGYRYVGWRRRCPFDWCDAEAYLHPRTAEALEPRGPPSTSAPGGRWKCDACGRAVVNQALLKRCPWCGGLGTLRPELAPS